MGFSPGLRLEGAKLTCRLHGRLMAQAEKGAGGETV